MRALYLYFADTATTGRGRSTSPDGVRPTYDDGPLVPIQPGAFSRWMANRNRVVAENAVPIGGTATARGGLQRSGQEREGAR
jgi:hypothetical protein